MNPESIVLDYIQTDQFSQYCYRSSVVTKEIMLLLQNTWNTPPFFLSSVTFRVPPWIQKRAGLESSGWRLISSIGKTEIIAFCFGKKKYFQIFRLQFFFKDFFRFWLFRKKIYIFDLFDKISLWPDLSLQSSLFQNPGGGVPWAWQRMDGGRTDGNPCV